MSYKKGLTFPKASKPLSKKRITPRKVKKIPKPMRPNPTPAKINQYPILQMILAFESIKRAQQTENKTALGIQLNLQNFYKHPLENLIVLKTEDINILPYIW